MTISSVSSGANPYTQGLQSGQVSDAFKQRKQDFSALSSALQSGDLAGAQKAFSALQQDTQALRQSRSGQGADQDGDNDGSKTSQASQASQASQNGKTSMQDLMNQLKQALSSGDLQGAQQAFATLQQNRQANGHHHHHHGGAGASNTTSASSTASNASSTSTINTTA